MYFPSAPQVEKAPLPWAPGRNPRRRLSKVSGLGLRAQGLGLRLSGMKAQGSKVDL